MYICVGGDNGMLRVSLKVFMFMFNVYVGVLLLFCLARDALLMMTQSLVASSA